MARPATMKGHNLTGEDEGRMVMSTRPPLSQIGILAGRFELVWWQESDRVELFDIERDPLEQEDISRGYPEVVVRPRAVGRS